MSRKLLTNALAVLIAILITGCSDNPSGVIRTDNVSILKKSESMEVFNTQNEPVYYFTATSGALATILWAPVSSEENEIKARSTREFPYAEIFGYEEASETNIVFFYWTGQNPDIEEVESVEIEVK